MLSRVIAQSVRSPVLRTVATSAQPTYFLASRTWTRGMAKENKSEPRFTAPPQTSSTSSQSSQKPTYSASSTPSRETPSPGPRPSSPERPTASTQSESPASEASKPPVPEAEDAEQRIPLSSLPDLTQGLPSTLEYETAGARKASQLALEGVTATGGSGQGKGELPASAYVSSSERRRQRLFNYMFGAFFAGTIGGTIYLGRNWDEEELATHQDVPNGWGLSLWWNRAMARLGEMLSYYQEPSFEKLLPDVDPMFERPYTLCISLEDMLVHSEWTREHGWRVAKRPGMDYFIRYLSQYYELVLFTSVPFGIAEPLWRKLDPYHFVTWPLFREATKYKDGKIVKDLSYLNRDLSKVIIIDTHPDHVSAQPENAILLPKWNGDSKDKDLVALIPFLEYIHTMQYKDVRDVLRSFEGKNIPEEFARREAIARKKFQEQLEAQHKKHPTKGSGMGFLGNMLGLKPNKMSMMVPQDGEQSLADALAEGKMLQDIARERGQRHYEELEKMVRENGEKWLKEEQEQLEKINAEAMQNMKSSFAGWFTGGAPKTEESKDEKKP